jgi:hypothetical protein
MLVNEVRSMKRSRMITPLLYEDIWCVCTKRRVE